MTLRLTHSDLRALAAEGGEDRPLTVHVGDLRIEFDDPKDAKEFALAILRQVHGTGG